MPFARYFPGCVRAVPCAIKWLTCSNASRIGVVLTLVFSSVQTKIRVLTPSNKSSHVVIMSRSVCFSVKNCRYFWLMLCKYTKNVSGGFCEVIRVISCTYQDCWKKCSTRDLCVKHADSHDPGVNRRRLRRESPACDTFHKAVIRR